MIELLYVSEGAPNLTREDIASILTTANLRNKVSNVTGALIYDGEIFMQILEGMESDVQPIYDSIKRDGRHSDIYEYYRGDINSRTFSDWSMGFHWINEDSELDINRDWNELSHVFREKGTFVNEGLRLARQLFDSFLETQRTA